MFDDIFKAVGPMVAAAMATKAASRDGEAAARRRAGPGFPFGDSPFNPGRFGFGPGGFQFEFDSDAEGMKLDDLDLMADPPQKLVLFGPDRVNVVEGNSFRVKADGPAAAELRFVQKGGMLAILRPTFERSETEQGDTVVTVTVPPLRSLVIAGSGMVCADALAESAKVTIAGSGMIELGGVRSERLEINVLGSGRLEASGAARRLKLNIAGSGMSDMAGLEAEQARITVAGSGSASFASDGSVEANLMGSGMVTVHGRAKCSVNSIGSGRLVCIPRESEAAPAAKPEAAPKPAKAPTPKPAAKGKAKPKTSAKATKPAKTSKAAKARKAPGKSAKPAPKPRKKAQ